MFIRQRQFALVALWRVCLYVRVSQQQTAAVLAEVRGRVKEHKRLTPRVV